MVSKLRAIRSLSRGFHSGKFHFHSFPKFSLKYMLRRGDPKVVSQNPRRNGVRGSWWGSYWGAELIITEIRWSWVSSGESRMASRSSRHPKTPLLLVAMRLSSQMQLFQSVSLSSRRYSSLPCSPIHTPVLSFSLEISQVPEFPTLMAFDKISFSITRQAGDGGGWRKS